MVFVFGPQITSREIYDDVRVCPPFALATIEKRIGFVPRTLFWSSITINVFSIQSCPGLQLLCLWTLPVLPESKTIS
jgi:hypothetical protein